jgi:HAD superfamily hydrolase (TIGR01509 family)
LDLGSIVHDDRLWEQWLWQLLRRLGVQAEFPALARLWRGEYLDDVHCGRCQFGAALRSFLFFLGLTRAEIDEVEAASQARRRQSIAAARPLPGVRPTLRRLHAAGIVLGVLANSEHPAAVLRRQLDGLALEGLFAAVLSSIDPGRSKPEPLCYLAAAEAMGRDGSQLAFVGHDAAELAGAARAGLMTVAFNPQTGAAADVFIARFEDLVGVVTTRPTQAAA